MATIIRYSVLGQKRFEQKNVEQRYFAQPELGSNCIWKNKATNMRVNDVHEPERA